MDKSYAERFNRAVGTLYRVRGQVMEPDAAAIWMEVHGKVPIEIFEEAVRSYNAESQDRFAPVPGAMHVYIDRAEAQVVLDRMRAEREPCLDGPRGCAWACDYGIVLCWHPTSVQMAIRVIRSGQPRTVVNRFGYEVPTIRQYDLAVPCQCAKGDKYAVQRKGIKFLDGTELPGRYEPGKFLRKGILNRVALEELWEHAEQQSQVQNNKTDFVQQNGGYRD